MEATAQVVEGAGREVHLGPHSSLLGYYRPMRESAVSRAAFPALTLGAMALVLGVLLGSEAWAEEPRGWIDSVGL